ncbi:hypothetical protein HK405_012536 [Cladochytrium tenue]|nr:hypothetical protein HK405_012536 [Cladochytrium tenue]
MSEGIHPAPDPTVLYARVAAFLAGYATIHIVLDHFVAAPLAKRLRLLTTDRVSVAENFPSYLAYSIYDLVTMAFQPETHWTMWVHHLMGAYGSFVMMFYRKLSIFPTYFMMTEATAVINNWLWYEETFGPSSPYLSNTTTAGNSAAAALTSANTKEKKKHRHSRPAPNWRVVTLSFLRAVGMLVLRSWCAPLSVVHAAAGTGGGLTGLVAAVNGLEGPGAVAVAWSGLACTAAFAVLNVLWMLAAARSFAKTYGRWRSAGAGRGSLKKQD